MTKRLMLSTAAAMLLSLPGAGPAVASPVRTCSYAEGGSFKNLTTRHVSCRAARPVARRIIHDVSPCFAREASMGSCAYTAGKYRVKGRWFKDAYGLDQLDLRGTASHHRVVRLQTEWDGE